MKDDLDPPVQAPLLLIAIIIQRAPLAIGIHLLEQDGEYAFGLKIGASGLYPRPGKTVIIGVAANNIAIPR